MMKSDFVDLKNNRSQVTDSGTAFLHRVKEGPVNI